jgi:OOP family OmpA-OmpF porin
MARTTAKRMVLAVVLSLAGASGAAADDRVDIGGFAGMHTFSRDNELGQVDVDDADSPDNSLAFGIRVGYALTDLVTAEGELALMPSSARTSNVDLFVIGWRAHGLVHLLGPTRRWRPFALLGGGALTASSTDTDLFDNDTDALFHAGLGVKLGVGRTWGVRADARVLFPPSTESRFATGEFEFLVGLYRTFPPEEKQPAPSDQDGDGITDDVDRCRDRAEDPDKFEDEDGCPDPDNDGDGILDAKDRCPNEPETANGIDDTDGCPEQDADSDGIIGTQDQCPNQPEDVDNHEDDDGCPEPDNDNDGILDRVDQCPDEPETKNNFEDEDGCADTVPTAVQQFTGTIEGIQFKTNSSQILQSSHATLDAAAKVLTDHPNVRLEIQGHTDSDASEAHNLDLSQRRADAVKTYLVGKGIDAARLDAKGYGESQPVADNATKEGKTKNRRVDFVLVGQGP